MTVGFDPGTGRVRLDAVHFEALCRQYDAPGSADPEAVAALQRAGALVAGVAPASLQPALAAVQRPIAKLDLLVTGAGGYLLHQGWMSIGSAVLADLGDGDYDFAAVATEFVPTLVARLTRLGLRPHLPQGRVALTTDVLDGLGSVDAAARADALRAVVAAASSTWPQWASRADGGEWRFWVADLSWATRSAAGDDGEGARRLGVVDTGAGLLRVDGGDAGPALVAVTPTEVWHLLSSILPADDDVLLPAP